MLLQVLLIYKCRPKPAIADQLGGAGGGEGGNKYFNCITPLLGQAHLTASGRWFGERGGGRGHPFCQTLNL